MLRILQPDRQEIPSLHRTDHFRQYAVEPGAVPSRVFMDQSLRGMQNSTRAYRWSVPFLIVYDERSVVGTIGGKGLMDAESEVELGYNVALPFRGRGIASRAIAEMCLLAASDGLDLLAHVEPENEASRRALLRNDFRMEALVRLPDSLDLERWSWSPD